MSKASHPIPKNPRGKRGARSGPKPPPAAGPVVPEKTLRLLAEQSRKQGALISAMAKRGGPFSSLGGDVDNMIEHGQEAWHMIRQLLNTESKSVDANAQVFATQAGTSVDLTAAIIQGDGDNQRNGDGLKIQGIDIRYQVNVNTTVTATTNAHFVRVILVASEDEPITAGDLLQFLNTEQVCESPVTWDTRQQYKKLYDRVHKVQYYDRASKGRIYLKDVDIHTQFFEGGTNVEKGAIQLFIFGDVSTATPNVGYGARLVYVDN